jgi:glyoxylase-like metal-dependent hydrolase (beta-lactamase superfamily II)
MIDPSGLGAAAQVLQVKYAERQVRRAEVFHDYGSYGLPDATLDMDYNFWVIRDADGITLVDTGYDVPARDWLGEIPVTPTPECLRRLDIAPGSVTRVVTSHFHYDHIGFLGLFGNAEVVSGGAEYDYWFGKRAAGALAGEFTTEEDLAVVAAAGGMHRALSLINRLAGELDATVVPGHDARTRDRFPALPGPASDVAVVLG